MNAAIDAFRVSYAHAFRDYLFDAGERTLRVAYELGRQAVAHELSVLELALVHHDVLISALRERDARDAAQLARGAGDFFLESLSAYEMVQRGFRDSREAALVERRQADVLRRLSSFLADASLALDASHSLEEMLKLVAEQARELLGASGCVATVAPDGDGETFEVASYSSSEPIAAADGAGPSGDQLAAPLTALDGRPLGSLQLFDKQAGDFTAVDEAVLVHLAQMASAAVERARHYRHPHPRG